MSRDELIFLAKICEQTERFEDMLDHMKKVAYLDQELSIDERNLLTLAYHMVISARRTALRVTNRTQTLEEAKNSKYLPLLRDYKEKIEKELNKYCDDYIELMDNRLIPLAKDNHISKVFFLSTKGSILGLKVEFSNSESYNTYLDAAWQSFESALQVGRENLHPRKPQYLQALLNTTTFLVTHKKDKSVPIALMRKAIEEADQYLQDHPVDPIEANSEHRDSVDILTILSQTLQLLLDGEGENAQTTEED